MQWVIVIIIDGIIWGIICNIVAHNKNIKGNWFIWGLLFSFIPFVILLTKKPQIDTSDTHLTRIANDYSAKVKPTDSRVGWDCPMCKKFNSLQKGVCECGFSTEETIHNAEKERNRIELNILSEGGWRCKKCGNLNNKHTFICKCGMKQKENEEYIEPKKDDNVEIIKKYKELLDMGAITQEEYEKKKSELL